MGVFRDSIHKALQRESWLRLAVTFAVYLASVKFGLYLYQTQHTSPAFIWPAAGIGLAAIILWGYEMWPAILLGGLVGVYNPAAPPLLLIISISVNTIQPLVAAYILRRFKFDPLLGHLRDMVLITAVSLFVTTIVPSVNLLAQYAYSVLIDPAATATLQWWWYWAGEVLSVLVLAPFLVRWYRPMHRRTSAEWFEIGANLGGLIVISYFLFWMQLSSFAGTSVLILYLVPLMWMALRVGPRFMTLGLFLTTAMAISGTMLGHHASTQPLSTRLASIEVFMEILAWIFLIIVAIVEERKNAARALHEHLQQLEEAYGKIASEDAAKSEFLAVLAHELRNPLAPLFSSLELLKLQSIGPEAGELIENMEHQVRTMGRLLDDLLDVTRISQKKLQLQKESVPLSALIEKSLKSTETLMSTRKHKLTVVLPKEPVRVAVDTLRFEQIITNLLTNSAKYTPPGGHIELKASVHGEFLSVSIKDDGLGIPEEMLGKIFEPFMQVSQGGRFRSTGLGIGLSLTKTLIEMHGGTIEVYSAGVGRGSEFIIRLPAVTTIPIMQTPTAEAPAGRGTQTFKILVVDDNEMAATSLRRLLEYRGHDVTVAYDAAEAFEAIRKFSPDTVLLDIGLPDVNGYDVAKRLRESRVPVTLIALSGYGQEEDKRKAREAGFNHHLTKPVSITDIDAVLRGMSDAA